ncbi:glycosyltransferase [Streptomyces sp. NBC_00536]|uniref:glycosyltransferase n=1 Tax=Streptomyces sp. NBC_00536 TaxID=2975769 RepID=UPI002E81CD86|nr:glycosyltransferase [Streptomyces sp. NBC_00536]WUC77330.1 glycosyltransferase [Streptomyces sp. NBC_00536]
MRVLMVTAGSWGDVAPYTGLGTRLRAAGHEVVLATHSRYEGAVTALGLGFRPLPVDPRTELASPAGQRLTRAVTTPVAMARVIRLAREFIPPLTDGVAAAVRAGADVVLASTLTEPLCATLAEGYGLPCVGVHLLPVTPTRAFPPLVVGGRSFGPHGNKLTGRAVWACGDRAFAPGVRALRRELGLPARRFSGPLGLDPDRRVHHGFSPLVLPRPADWPAGHRVGGYWWPERPPGWRPERRLLDFLDAGPPPVFAGFGSLVAGDAERLGGLLAAALRKAKVRGIVQAGWSGLSAEGDDLISVGEVPHDWLFPRTAAVIHHTGAGTTAAGLRAGVPTVPVPVQLDQPFWAARLYALGVAPRPVRYQRLTVDGLAAAIRAATTDPGMLARARGLSVALAREDGAEPLLKTLAELG